MQKAGPDLRFESLGPAGKSAAGQLVSHVDLALAIVDPGPKQIAESITRR
jgi:hypothetical protein